MYRVVRYSTNAHLVALPDVHDNVVEHGAGKREQLRLAASCCADTPLCKVQARFINIVLRMEGAAVQLSTQPLQVPAPAQRRSVLAVSLRVLDCFRRNSVRRQDQLINRADTPNQWLVTATQMLSRVNL